MLSRSCFLLLLFCLGIQGRNLAATVSGKVLLPDGSAAEMVNVILLQAADSAVVKGAISDATGKFSFEDIQPGSYRLLVSQPGGRHYTVPFIVTEDVDTQVPDIHLPEQVVTLPEMKVSAFRPFIEHRIDETIVNVENSIVNAG